MANGPGLSTAKGGEIYVGNTFRETFTLLDVLYANHFEGESFNPNFIDQTEENFYRGAPPIWLNFHISKQASSGGTGIPLIKRDGYETLVQQIQQREWSGIPTVKLFHQPGCGGTTLAMQVLWDLRKTFRCAVLTGSTSDRIPYMLDQVLAKEVVQLFTAGSQGHQNTVLLLLQDEQIWENLQERIMEEIAAQKIVPCMPVVVVLSCLRKDANPQSDHVFLKKALSDTETQKFNEKKRELSIKYPDQHEQFHAFNIMQTNFSQAYVRQVCSVFSNVQRTNKPPKTQLAAFLALLNSYVPGSYLLESQCLEFLKQNESISLEDIMKPFSQLIVTFTQNTSSEKRVHMAHPMIAQTCTELMAEAGVTRSGTARNFMIHFCRVAVPTWLLDFIKNMLTKRETKINKNRTENKEKKEMFSRLILDIQNNEERGHVNSALVFKIASKNFCNNPFFPQALARLYYIVIKNYNLAEMWAKEAQKRDIHNSFIADTLGQVHKNHLKSKTKEKEIPAKPRDILQLAERAIKAFNHEEELAENESETDIRQDGNINVSHVHNTRGQFGYLQVCDILYDFLESHNETWREVLKGKVPLGSVLHLLGDNKLFRFYDLIKSLRDDVKDKCVFLNAFLTYSKPGMHKDDPPECKKTVESCYRRYVEAPVPDLVTEIKNKFKSYMEENIAAIPKDNENISLNLMQLIKKTNCSYDSAYAKYFRSRYLCPLFYLGKDETLGRIVPVSIKHFLLDTTEDFIDHMINKDWIFRDLRVQENLLKFYGKVKNYSIIASVGGADITLKANMRDSTWKQREVSFYLGFTIRGPVAFGIQKKPHVNGRKVIRTNNIRINKSIY